MALLQLSMGSVLQGRAEIRALNLMLVFQVNCPGCLSQALPQLDALQKRFPELNCFGLSTAFEDFALNTLENTQKLLHEGRLPLASARYFSRLGHAVLPYSINVPVLMDRFAGPDQIDDLYQAITKTLSDTGLNQSVTDQTRQLISQRLQSVLCSGRTFLNNQFQGTPSWVLFDDQMEIVDQWFGHRPLAWVESLVESAMPG